MDFHELNTILLDVVVFNANIYYRSGEDDGQMWIQACDTKLGDVANGRKWRISQFSTKSELVQTCFMAYLAWLEHEARENFTYKDEAIFGPHFDVEALVGLAKSNAHDVRSQS